MSPKSLAITTIFLLLISLSLQTLQIFHRQKLTILKNLLKIFFEVKKEFGQPTNELQNI